MSLPSSLKKRKQPPSATNPGVPTKKSKHSAANDVQAKKDKGNGRETEFQVTKASIVLSIAPVFAQNPRAGVEEMLDSMMMRYIPAFRGVVLSHSNLEFIDKKAIIKAECPFLVCSISFDATVWSPHVRMKLAGQINLSSPDHISLLAHKTFNISIPRHHIPTDKWEFEYHASDEESNVKPQGENMGRWVNKNSREPLGGPDGYLEFTVVGLTVANEMLSLVGSIQEDPFSVSHVPITHVEHEDVMMDVDVVVQEEGGESEEEEEEVDSYAALGAQTDHEKEEVRRKSKKRKDRSKEVSSKKKKKSLQ